MQQQDKYRIALLAAFAVSLHGFDTLLPSPMPWLRLGLANSITLVTLLLYGMRAALMVTLIRVILSSLLAGTFLGPAFILSFGGGITSTCAMGAALFLMPRFFSTMGLSLIGALFHNLAQLLLAYVLFVQRIEAVLVITPLIIFIGTLTGAMNGAVAALLMKHLQKNVQKVQNVDTDTY
jgi:heptaprenyl diphosphate synthase